MDANTILQIRPALTGFLHQFDDCFARSQTREHMSTYVQGQLGPLPRKSVEPIADAAGTPPRTLQEFLSLSRWDEAMMRDRLQQRVARHHAHEHAVGLFDESSFLKKGDKTACVQRQHCGAAGKVDNCVVSVHLGYATPGTPGSSASRDLARDNFREGGFHTLLDGELYLPEKTWHEDRPRCAEAGIPDDVVYRTKHEIALGQYRRAVANGVRFAWLTFDEFYGRNTAFLRAFDAIGQNYVAEVPRDFHVWTRRPQVRHRRHGRELNPPGRPRRYPRLKVKNNPTARVDELLRHSPVLRRQRWTNYYVKDGSKGPMVWQVKHALVYLKDEQGLPACGGRPYHLIIARNVLDPGEVKFFISNAPASTPVETMLPVAFSRHRIERMFEDSKMELGLDHFEVRRFGSISRHLLLSCVSHLFLAEFQEAHAAVGQAGEKNPDAQPDRHRPQRAGRPLVRRRPLLPPTRPGPQRATGRNPTAQRQGSQEPPQTHDPAITRDWHHAENLETMSMEADLAL
ncbi:MAG TPA: transposase [Opitutaceae bacterium]